MGIFWFEVKQYVFRWQIVTSVQQEPQAFTLFDRGKNDKTDKN